MPPTDSPVYTVAQSRARHSAITFLMGMVFENFGNLMGKFSTIFSHHSQIPKYAFWAMTALNHDRAYTSDRLSNPSIDYEKTFRHVLLQDTYCDSKPLLLSTLEATPENTMAYTYDEIKKYDQFARVYHARHKGGEKVDHGILGGHILFDTILR